MTQAEVETTAVPDEWEEAERFTHVTAAIRTLAERAIDYNVEALALIKEVEQERYKKLLPHYNGALPMIIGGQRYFCLYRLKPEEKTKPG